LGGLLDFRTSIHWQPKFSGGGRWVMSPVQGRSITGLESESAARTCLIAGPSVKHPREAPERKLSSFGFLRCGRKRNWRIRGGRARGRGGRGGRGWLGGAIPWGIYSFIHSFIHSICLRWLGKVVIHSPTVMMMQCWSSAFEQWSVVCG